MARRKRCPWMHPIEGWQCGKVERTHNQHSPRVKLGMAEPRTKVPVTDPLEVPLALVLCKPERFIPRTRLLHLAVVTGAWALCDRARAGKTVGLDQIGVVQGGVPWSLCSRCLARMEVYV